MIISHRINKLMFMYVITVIADAKKYIGDWIEGYKKLNMVTFV